MTVDESSDSQETPASDTESGTDTTESTPPDSPETRPDMSAETLETSIQTAAQTAAVTADAAAHETDSSLDYPDVTDDTGVTSTQPMDFEDVDADTLGFDPSNTDIWTQQVQKQIEDVHDYVDDHTVTIQDKDDDFNEDDFFTTESGVETIVDRYDLEKTVPDAKKTHFVEEERYWVNKPFSYIVIFHSTKENEKKYYAVEPHLTDIEDSVKDFLIRKLRKSIKYSGDKIADNDDLVSRAEVIEESTEELLDRFGIRGTALENGSLLVRMARSVGIPLVGDTYKDIRFEDGVDDWEDVFESVKDTMLDDDDAPMIEDRDWIYLPPEDMNPVPGQTVRPEPKLIEEDNEKLTEYQIRKLMYYLKRDFVGYQRIDPVKNDINVEDISVDGYNQPVFVYHGDYEQIISNIYHGKEELDDFVVKLAQRSGKGISKRTPQVDATLPDGSRAQLTLGAEVSDHGTNYTIRQFKDVPFTPIDLISWNTFSLDEMSFLWLCIENHRSLIFAGGTASGKTTSLNAISLFIPSAAKIVSIEDTREVELPQRNWIASVTRPSFSDDDKGDVDEFDLLEAALRQRPDYIVMGEIRGEEGRTLFQVMSTGHTTYTTFHADSVGEVLKRFTTDPINVSKTMFTALDLVSIQTQTRVQGSKVRRNKVLTEVNDYIPENDEINVQDVYEWQPETDHFQFQEGAETLDELKFDRGWNQDKLERELLKRRTVLAYLMKKELNEYSQVAATIQAFITDPDAVLRMIAEGNLENNLADLREMESVSIDIDQSAEDMVPRPTPDSELSEEIDEVLEEAQERLFSDMDIDTASGKSLGDVLGDAGLESGGTIEPDSDDDGGSLDFLDTDDDDDEDLPDFLGDNEGGEEADDSDDNISDDDDLPFDFEDDDDDIDSLFGGDDSDDIDEGIDAEINTPDEEIEDPDPDSIEIDDGGADESAPSDSLGGSGDNHENPSDDTDDSDGIFNTDGEDALSFEEFDSESNDDGSTGFNPDRDTDDEDEDDDDKVYGKPSQNTAGSTSVESVEKEEKRKKFAGMDTDDDDSSWVFEEDDDDETLFGDDDPFENDDEGNNEDDDEDDDEDDGDWVEFGGD